MSPKKEYFLILLVSIGTPLIVYFSIVSYFKNTDSMEEKKESLLQRIQTPVESKTISLLFVGDIMLDRTIRKDGEQYGYANLFACLEHEFSKHDEVIGNLEGTITNFTSVSRDAAYEAPESFRFTFDEDAVRALVDIGLSIVSLANNHIRDFGEEGITQTLRVSNELGLETFGNPLKGSQRYLIKDIDGTKIAFIPYNQFFGTREQTLEDLVGVQNLSDLQIIFAHWGDEYTPARSDIKLLAKSFVDNGSDLIIGAHPHVIQESELYKEVPIYYSLGNFIFDQYWEEAVRTGLGVQVEIKDKKIITHTKKFFESTRHKGTCEKVPVPQG
jgi:poly-gamma-glutamate synthesis protein (capsule biosynthesis protein)